MSSNSWKRLNSSPHTNQELRHFAVQTGGSSRLTRPDHPYSDPRSNGEERRPLLQLDAAVNSGVGERVGLPLALRDKTHMYKARSLHSQRSDRTCRSIADECSEKNKKQKNGSTSATWVLKSGVSSGLMLRIELLTRQTFILYSLYAPCFRCLACSLAFHSAALFSGKTSWTCPVQG